MKKTALIAGAALAALTVAAPAHAGNAEGKLQVKLLATAVLPDGKVVGAPKVDPLGLVPGAVGGTRANDNVVPTIAVEYFFTPNISVETICCVTGHHVSVAGGALDGAVALDNVQIIPATLTAKYHMPLGAIKPYVGVGPTLFIMLNNRPSDAVKAAVASGYDVNITRSKLSSELGVAVQAGADIALGNGYSMSLDAKKYWVRTDATFYTATGVGLQTRHKLDPWVLSAGVAYRF